MKQKREKTTVLGITLIAIAAFFGSIGQIFFKFAANKLTDVASLLFNHFLYLGLFSYGIGLLFMIKALRHGELTVIYPVMATSFIWVGILSPIFFHTDSMTLHKWLGVLIIIAGVALVGKGRQR